MIYNLLIKQIDKKNKFINTEAKELQDKIDVFYLANRINKNEYQELTEKLKLKTEI